MDDNGVNGQSQNQGIQGGTFVPSQQPAVQPVTQPTAPLTQNPIQMSQPVMQSTPQQPQQSPSVDTSGKITLNDLYGPSSPEERNTISSQQVQSPPAIASEADPSTLSPQPSILSPQNSAPAFPSDRHNDTFSQTPTSVTVEQVSSGDDPPRGFRFPPMLKFIIGATVVLLIGLILVSFIKGLLHPSTTGKVTLTYWGLWEDANVYQGIINDFERDHPNITINYIKQDPNKYTDRLLTRIQNGLGPDIFRYHNSWVTPLQSVLLPLPQNVLDSNTLTKSYPPVVAQDLVKNGAILGLPLEVDTLSLFVNKDIFDHAGASVPTTWDQFITVAKALTVKDSSGKIKTSGAAMGTFDNIDHAPDIISLLLLQNGADLQKLSGSQNAIDALTFYTSFANTDNNVWDSTLDNSTLAFARGQLAMFFGYSWDMLAVKGINPTLNFAVYPVPHLPGRNMTVASYWVEGISNRSTHPKEAAEFLAYLAQKDTQTKLYTAESQTRQFGELYAPSDLASTLESNPLLAPFVKQAGSAVSTFFVGETEYDEFNGSLNQYLGNAVSAVLGNTSIDTAMTTLSQGVAQIFNQYAQPTP